MKEKLSEREKFNLGVTLDKAIAELSQADPKNICLNSAVIFNREQNSFILPYLNRKYLVNHRTGEVKSIVDGKGVSIQMQILFLHYLSQAQGSELQEKWITFKELPGGQIYVEPYQNRTIRPLLKYFGEKPEKFAELAVELGGKASSFGDISMIMRPLPRVPIMFVLWEGDEEFPASANILYDAVAPDYLPTEDYALLPGLIIFEMAAMLS
ncbi:MAG: DUF3786 domain-containing protein [Firmicutes bacterium]|nr:DUF3786 domain-containing protein [Bacillota bacterium]